MATAKFFTTAKRHNSTLIPTGGTDINVYLKDGSDLIAPVFKLNYSGVPAWSMMQFEGRYYFITDIASVRQDLWEITAAVDVLATYKSNIQAMRPFVLYADANNTEIIDHRLPAKTTAVYAKNYATLSQSLMTGQWKIAVSVVGSESTSTFLLTPAQVKQLVTSTNFDNWFNQLWQDVGVLANETDGSQASVTSSITNAGSQIQGASDTLGMLKGLALASNTMAMAVNWAIGDGIRTFILSAIKTIRKIMATPNAMDCVKSAIFLPWDVVGDGSAQQIMLGEFPTGVTALPVYNPIQHGQASVAIPWQATDWRRNAPYHQIYLYLPFMGDIEISPSDIIGCDSLNIYYSLNVMTGALNYRVATDQDTTIGVFSCQTGVAYPIGASNITPVQVGMGIGTAAAAITGAPSLAAAASIAASSLNAIKPNASCVGGGGGGAGSGLDLRIICHSVFHDTNVAPSNPSSSIGQPVDSEVTLSILSGFVQTQNASVSGSMTDTEREAINRLLDGGIYIE